MIREVKSVTLVVRLNMIIRGSKCHTVCRQMQLTMVFVLGGLKLEAIDSIFSLSRKFNFEFPFFFGGRGPPDDTIPHATRLTIYKQ